MKTRRSIPNLLVALALPLSLAVGARAQSCQVVGVGTTCGAGMTGSLSQPPTLNLAVKIPGNTSGFLILGTQALSVTLPAGCILLTDPFVSFAFSGGATGVVNFKAPIPGGFRGRVRTQVILLLRVGRGIIIRASNAIELACK